MHKVSEYQAQIYVFHYQNGPRTFLNRGNHDYLSWNLYRILQVSPSSSSWRCHCLIHIRIQMILHLEQDKPNFNKDSKKNGISPLNLQKYYSKLIEKTVCTLRYIRCLDIFFIDDMYVKSVYTRKHLPIKMGPC